MPSSTGKKKPSPSWLKTWAQNSWDDIYGTKRPKRTSSSSTQPSERSAATSPKQSSCGSTRRHRSTQLSASNMKQHTSAISSLEPRLVFPEAGGVADRTSDGPPSDRPDDQAAPVSDKGDSEADAKTAVSQTEGDPTEVKTPDEPVPQSETDAGSVEPAPSALGGTSADMKTEAKTGEPA